MVSAGGVVEGGLGAEQDCLEQGHEAGVLDVVLDGLVGLEVLGVVDGGVVGVLIVEKMRDSHFVLSEGSCFVRADAGSGPKGLHRLQVLHEHSPGSHSLGGKSHADSDSDKETFGDVRDDDTDHENDVRKDGVPVGEGDREEEETGRDGNGCDDLDEAVDLFSDGSLSSGGTLGEVSDLTDDGLIACLEDNSDT